MNNDLDSFTVERLEELSTKENIPEVAALARIALAAKSAEPDYYIVKLKFNDGWGDETVLDTYETKLDAIKSKADHGGEIIPVYTTPQLNSPEIPEGWKLVPIELTAEMAQAAGEAHEGESYLPYSIYRVMLAAAPEKQ
ncbi:TPA: hypothetical protein PXO03_004105 [Yersinia enterocolitica]|nr:hypothetical protein [Yersinia enterocolitica]